MTWHARLKLDYRREQGRSVARFEHDGPLRILQSLYPEGDGICHNVLVHPPGGLVGGDTLELAVTAAAGSHGLVTTPGAARFYRSAGAPATQHTRIGLAEGARFEWLPLETICYPGCQARNRVEVELAPGAELIGWDVAALGLPQARQAFDRGSLLQHLELRTAHAPSGAGAARPFWLERGRIDASDQRLLESQLGLAGRRCMATLFWAGGDEFSRARRDQALEIARGVIDGWADGAAFAGATAPDPRVVVVRVLAPLVEPALDLLKTIRRAWRPPLWSLPAIDPRSWAT
jgi:urease accessory protein